MLTSLQSERQSQDHCRSLLSAFSSTSIRCRTWHKWNCTSSWGDPHAWQELDDKHPETFLSYNVLKQYSNLTQIKTFVYVCIYVSVHIYEYTYKCIHINVHMLIWRSIKWERKFTLSMRNFFMIVSAVVVLCCTVEEIFLQRGRSAFYLLERAFNQTFSETSSPVYFGLLLYRTPFAGAQLLPPKNLVMITVRKL